MKKEKKNKKLPVPATIETGSTKAVRESGFELMRIFAMLLIIGHHLTVYGGPLTISFSEKVNRYTTQFLHLGGVLGVNLFFMLTGYFAVQGTFRLKRLLKIDFAAIFYSVALICVMTFAFKQQNNTYTWVKSFLPISLENYWFITIYAAVFLLSPFFNRLINTLSKAQFIVMALVMMMFITIIPILNFANSVNHFRSYFSIGLNGYFMGAYIRKYPPSFLNSKSGAGIMAVISYAALGVLSIYSYKYADTMPVWKVYKEVLFRHESILMILCSASIFMFFANLKIGNVKWINFIAQAMLGVYMIHECPVFRGCLWGTLLKSNTILHSKYFMLQSLRIIMTVFICCTAIELLRIYLIEKPLFKLKVFDKLCEAADKFMNGVNKE